MDEQRVCNKCGTKKKLTEFKKGADCKGGYRGYCMQCHNSYMVVYNSTRKGKESYARKQVIRSLARSSPIEAELYIRYRQREELDRRIEDLERNHAKGTRNYGK